MINVHLPIDLNALIATETKLVTQMDALDLDATPDFVTTNHLRALYRQWFEDNTSEGWVETYSNLMRIVHDPLGQVMGVDFLFDDPKVGMLFKLTFKGV
jgi:hypothetical protein